MKHSDGKIQIGDEIHFDPKTHETISKRPIYAKRTPELEEAEDRMLEDFSKSLLPLFVNDMEMKKKDCEK